DGGLGGSPPVPGGNGSAGGAGRRIDGEQFVPGSTREEATCAGDVDEPVPLDAVGADLAMVEGLAAERFHRVAPQLCDAQPPALAGTGHGCVHSMSGPEGSASSFVVAPRFHPVAADGHRAPAADVAVTPV